MSTEENKLFVYMFEAFDKSLKSTYDPKDKASNKGFIEYCWEAYYGWRKRKDDSAPVEYVKKYKGTINIYSVKLFELS